MESMEVVLKEKIRSFIQAMICSFKIQQIFLSALFYKIKKQTHFVSKCTRKRENNNIFEI